MVWWPEGRAESESVDRPKSRKLVSIKFRFCSRTRHNHAHCQWQWVGTGLEASLTDITSLSALGGSTRPGFTLGLRLYVSKHNLDKNNIPSNSIKRNKRKQKCKLDGRPAGCPTWLALHGQDSRLWASGWATATNLATLAITFSWANSRALNICVLSLKFRF